MAKATAALKQTAKLRHEEFVTEIRRIVFGGASVGQFMVVESTSGYRLCGEQIGEQIVPECSYRFFGAWQDHEKHGRQFRWSSYQRHLTADRVGLVRYLTEFVDGIGDVRAKRLWDRWQGKAVEVLRERPAEVVAAGILDELTAKRASETLLGLVAVESTRIDLLTLFTGRGFPVSRTIEACLRRWQVRAPAIIRRNPFALLVAGIPGAGFHRCDQLYLDMQRPPCALKRQMLAIWYVLDSDTSGHTWRTIDVARRSIERHIGDKDIQPERALELGLRSGWLAKRVDHRGREWIAEGDRARAEITVANCLNSLLAWNDKEATCSITS